MRTLWAKSVGFTQSRVAAAVDMLKYIIHKEKPGRRFHAGRAKVVKGERKSSWETTDRQKRNNEP
jgi:hypothetical protein